MTNAYYNYTTNIPVAQSRGVSSQLRAEFAQIDAGFNALSLAMSGFATLLNPAFQGSPSAPTQAPGTNNNALATCAFVLAASFSAALPSQGGNAGKYITTNGTVASWGNLNWLLFSQDKKRLVTASTATTTIDLQGGSGDEATVYKVTIAANSTLTFSNFPAAAGGEAFTFTLMTVNDATAGRALAFGNTIKWAGGVLPTRTTAANAIDIWTFWYENSVLYGSLALVNAS